MTEEDIVSKEWVLHGRWLQPPLSGGFWQHWHKSNCAKEMLPDGPWPEMLFLDGNQLTSKEDVSRVDEFFAKSFQENTLNDFLSRIEIAAKKYEAQHLALLSQTSIQKEIYIPELFRTYLEFSGPWGFMFRFAENLENLAKKEGFAKSDEDILSAIAPYRRPTLLEEQASQVREFSTEIARQHPGINPREVTPALLEADPELINKIKSHLQTFDWFGTHHWEAEGYSLEKCLDDIRSFLKDPPQMENTKKGARGENVQAESLWKLIESFFYWRTHCAEITAKVVFRSRGILTDLASEWGIAYSDLTYFTADEIRKALIEGKTSLPGDYQERRLGYGAYRDNANIEHIIMGSDLKHFLDAAMPKADVTVTELQGVVGSKGGIVRGRAKIILSPADFSKFVDGDILVVPETAPDFVALIKKAKAVVTQVGGVTSHAAIVCRELGKPCVINTKIATQVFKDGDTIEVNAESGIVRKLS